MVEQPRSTDETYEYVIQYEVKHSPDSEQSVADAVQEAKSEHSAYESSEIQGTVLAVTCEVSGEVFAGSLSEAESRAREDAEIPSGAEIREVFVEL